MSGLALFLGHSRPLGSRALQRYGQRNVHVCKQRRTNPQGRLKCESWELYVIFL